MTVSTGGEITSLNNAFTITGATPALLSVVPSSGVQGQTLNVVITGNALYDIQRSRPSGRIRRQHHVDSTTQLSPNQA